MKDTVLNAFEEYVRQIMESYGAVGLAISALEPQKTLYRKFFGWADLEQRRPINEDTLFGLASITKSFTCLAIMQLYEKGLLDINAPVSQYIPEFHPNTPDTVRVYHLMSHSAGFYPQKRLCAETVARQLGIYGTGEELAYSIPLAEEGIRQIVERLNRQTRFVAEPGDFFSYSNDSYGLLAEIIRRCGPEDSYAQYLNRHLLEPLGMERSCCDFLKPAQDGNTATLYYTEDGKRCASRDFHRNAFVLMGGGALKSTIAEMEKYLRMYLLKGWGEMEQVVQSQSIGQMIIPQVNYRYRAKYGFGLAIHRMEDIRLIGHGGSLPGVSSQFLWSPELQKGVVVLCNTSGIPAFAIAQAAMRMLAGLEPVAEPVYPQRSWLPETVEDACGEYSCEEGYSARLVKVGSGIGLETPQGTIPGRMAAPDVLIFRQGMVDTDVKLFFRKMDGAVWGMRQNGRVLRKQQP